MPSDEPSTNPTRLSRPWWAAAAIDDMAEEIAPVRRLLVSGVDENVIDLLICPRCRGELRWAVTQRREQRIVAADASSACQASLLGWRRAAALPTPDGENLPARVDGFPDHPTEVQWPVIAAQSS
jgi:uncharacterized protein YbaR (Trm112 family)